MNEKLLAAFLKNYMDRFGTIPGRKAYQKLLYFAQLLGWPSDYSYRLHFYGPYSDEADRALELLEEGGAVVTQPAGAIQPAPYLAELAANPGVDMQPLAALADAFGGLTPKELELLATVRFLWDSDRRVRTQPTEQRITGRLKNLKPNKFTDQEIAQAFQSLGDLNLLPEL
jgi:hypothetical protein